MIMIKEINEINKEIIFAIADLHKRSFPAFFLTQLGIPFLKTLYKSYIEDPDSGIIAAYNADRLVGFIAYSNDYPLFYKRLIKHHLIKFAFCSLHTAIRHPSYIKRLLGAFKKSDTVVKNERYVELASICVDHKVGKNGIGSALIDYLKGIVDFNFYSYINLETDAVNNDYVNSFYIKNGFKLERVYQTAEGRKMNEYRFGYHKAKRKLLYILNEANRFNNFAYSSYLAAKEANYEFHIAGFWTGYKSDKDILKDEKTYGIKIHNIDFYRKPYNLRNIKAYNQVLELVRKEKYDIVHCNTPIGGVVGRLVGKRSNIKTVIYQAHGFHFYKGSSIINWLLFYPIEKWLARYTDAIITINHEDYDLAKSFRLKNGGNVYYIPGVGIDVSQYSHRIFNRTEKRKELGIPQDAIMIISVGELNKNKNNSIIIDTLKAMINKNVYYVICGDGPEKQNLQNRAKNNNVLFLGFRNDIVELLGAADIYVLPSKREGLSRSLMEAMAVGLPCVVSDIRGNIDLISNRGGFICKNTVSDYLFAFNSLIDDKEQMQRMGSHNQLKVKQLDISNIVKEYTNIYLLYKV